MVGQCLRRARNSEQRQARGVEDQNRAAQSINKPITIECQQSCRQRDGDISPVAERRDRSRANHDVASDPAATKDNTSTPKIPSLFLTPATPPLRANTNVPPSRGRRETCPSGLQGETGPR